MSSVANRVAFVEPLCWGMEHVPFNAALIATALEACQDATVDAYGEPGHLDALQELLQCTRPLQAARVHWHPVAIPARRAVGRRRLVAARRLFADLERAFSAQRPAALVVATTTTTILTLLKLRLFGAWAGLPTVAVFHQQLAMLGHSDLPLRRLSFTVSLRLPHPRGLTYVVLAESILRHIEQMAPWFASRAIAIDHPSLLGDVPGGDDRVPTSPLRFGFVGAGRGAKGLGDFTEIAAAVRRVHPDVAFEVAGSAPPDPVRSAQAGLTWPDRRLPLVEYVRRLRGLSHVIWLGEPAHYTLVASGSLVDSIAIGLPVICRSGPLVDHLFSRLGDIGANCATLADVQREVLRLVAHQESAPDVPLRDRLHRARIALSPEAAAPQLAAALSARRS